jgi:hypothetical protein
MFRAIVVLSLAGVLQADDAFSPPLIGYVFDGGVRQMVGSPGAARVLPPLALDVPIAKIALAPGRPFAIASLTDGSSLALVRFGAETGTPAIAESVKAFDSAAFNRTGTAVAVYSAECGCIQVVTGLPNEPVVAQRIDVTGVTAMALSNDGLVVAYSRESETVTTAGRSWPVSATALAFSPDDSSIAVVDGTRKSISIAAAELTHITDGLAEPTAASFVDPTTLLVADGRFVRAIDISTAQVDSTECFCKVSLIEQTAMKHVFRISDLAHGAVWILERSDQSSRAVFVPVQSEESEQ